MTEAEERGIRFALLFTRLMETGKFSENGAALSINNDGAGISYGTNQVTEGSGGLLELLRDYYVPRAGAWAWKLRPYIEKLEKGVRLTHDSSFKDELLRIGNHPSMLVAQQEFFLDKYMFPAVDYCRDNGLLLPLSLVVVYDYFIQSGEERASKALDACFDDCEVLGVHEEKECVIESVNRRDKWLATISHAAVTRYRTRTLLGLCQRGEAWECHPMSFTFIRAGFIDGAEDSSVKITDWMLDKVLMKDLL